MAALADVRRMEKVQQIDRVHFDDIHAILPLADQTFVTGSKDGSLKKWDWNGRLVRTIYDPGKIDYHSWITALASLGKDQWLSGTRDGYIHLWDVEGREIEQIAEPPKVREDRRCKARNVERINCLADFTFGSAQKRFLAGAPTQFRVYEKAHFEQTAICKTSENDWVYAIHPIDPRKALIVTGGRLDLIQETEESRWVAQRLIREGQKIEGQRSFISAITPLRGHPNWFGLSVFNGFTLVYDLEARKMVSVKREHQKRVWTIENIDEHTFASCADDGLIKLWDSRHLQKSFGTFRDNPKHPARVSVLLSPKEHLLISGACPDNVRETEEKATLSFWDLRKR